MKKWVSVLLLLVLTLATKSVYACTVCFGGDPNSTNIQAIKWGILSLLLVLGVVLFLFTIFFIEFQKRAKKTME